MHSLLLLAREPFYSVLAKLSYAEALRVGIIFGSVEAITPVVGWLAGRAASGYIAAFDHWIAFGLSGAIGAKMVLGQRASAGR